MLTVILNNKGVIMFFQERYYFVHPIKNIGELSDTSLPQRVSFHFLVIWLEFILTETTLTIGLYCK